MSVPGSAEGSTRKRPSFAFWDRQRKTSTNTSFVPPLKAAEERNRDALSASPVRRREDLDESSTGWGGISSIVSLDQEVAERERKSFERRAQEYDIASGGTGFDSMMTQNPSKGAARSSLPLQHFDHFSLPDFTSSAASSVSANSSWTSDRASSLDPPSRRDPELAPGPSRGGLDGASMIRSQSGSVLTSPSRTEVPSHRHSREASSSSSLPRAASKDLGRQYQYDEAQETTTEGEGDSDAATYTRDAARSRRRRQMLRESLRKRTKKRGGLGNQGAKPAQARGESGSDGSSSAWDSGDDEQSDSEDVEEGQSFTPGGRRLRQSRQGGESDPSQSSRRQSIGNSLSGTPKKPGRSGAGDAVNEELVAPSSQEDAVETFFDAPTQKHSETDDLGGTSFLPSPLIPSAGTMTPNRSHSPSNDWVTSSKNASHKLNDPSSSSTLRQDAAKLAVLGHSDRSQGTNHHLPTQNESHGYRTPTASLSVANPLATHSFIPSLSSTDTPSGAARSSSSPYSPLGIPSSPTSSLRNLRSGPLPPPRPSPTAPLPPPPNHSDEAGGSPDSPARGPNPAFLSPRVLTSIGEARSRVRSQSLGQASEALQRTGRSRTQESTITASNDAIARTSSPAAPRESRSASFDGDGPHSRKAYAALISESDSGGPRAASSSLGPSGTIRGRPRGATIGAVPSASAYMTSSGRISVQPKSRPRSLLCNEIVPALDARDTIAKLAPISGSPVPGMAASASSPSDLFGLGAISATSASANTSVSADSNARTISSSATSMSKASIQGSLEGSDEYEDQVSSTSNPRIGHHNNLEKSGGSSGGNVGGEGSSGRKALSSNRSRSGSNTSLLQQVRYPPKSYAAFVIAVVGHHSAGKSTVIKKGLRQFGLSKPNFLSDRVASHSTVCVVDQEQRMIEVLEIDASVLLSGPGQRFVWPKFLPRIDAVILCYDAAKISSFRGMSELLENFAMANLSTVMLACKSEVHPKAVDPYYASDMASVYNVGLAECTVQSEEGKKRMRDCFSYLVKEVAKARSGKQRRSSSATSSSALPMQASKMRSASSQSSASVSASLVERDVNEADFSSPRGSMSSNRARGDSGASSIGASVSSSGASYIQQDPGRVSGEAWSPLSQGLASRSGSISNEARSSSRKMSNATSVSETAMSASEDEAALQQSIDKAKLGLQSAKSAGGYVSIDELWNKLFYAAVSGNDDRFLLMFMVFYRGFTRPLDLLRQMISRFESLANSEASDRVMIRFSLMRLTAMLGDWVQDYPGDLSGPETYPLLLSFYTRLLQHPSTTHTASPLKASIESVATAPDLDALWANVVNSDKPRSVAADVPPVNPHLGPESDREEVDNEPSSIKSASSNSLQMAREAAPQLAGQDDSSEPPSRTNSDPTIPDRSLSERSAFLGTAMDPSHPGRHRSASDLTTSSAEISRSSSRPATSQATPTGTAGGAAVPGTWPPNSLDPQKAAERKAILRNVSNTLAEIDDEVIAAELTRLEWLHFTAIRPRDLLRHILIPRDQREGPVSRSIVHFNYISGWVTTMILAQGKTKARARMLEKFYNIAAILRHSNNYSTLQSVLGGLSKTAIHRLRNTRELLKGKPVIKTYLSLVRLMANERSNAAYRLALENSEGPTIPYVGVHLQDILSISDGNPSKRASDGMIHWRKFSLMDEAVMAIVKCQQYDRSLRPNPSVEKLIVGIPILDDEECYQRSLVVEPRSGNSAGGSKIAAGKLAGSKIKDLKTFLQA